VDMEPVIPGDEQRDAATGASSAPGFDPDVLRDKYRRERDKRLRPEGSGQYIEVDGSFAHFLDDPHAGRASTRAPLHDAVDVLIIGAGIGGLLCGARLRQAGIDKLRLIDPASDVGGTWYWNRYPGIACDIESYTYLPLLEEVGYMPRAKYATGDEILAHCQAIARKYDLYRDACFQTRVETLRWDEQHTCWQVTTQRGDSIRARSVCLATGPLNRPKLPGIPGIETFEGHAFHASRWDYRYTGGDATGGLTGLADKRVGIIGTGATAVQCVPPLGASARHLYVFQRTPSSVDVKFNPPTDPQWVASLPSGWQRHRMKNFNALVSGVPQSEDLVHDGWTDLIGRLLLVLARNKGGDRSPAGVARAVELADFEKMEAIRARIDSAVRDTRTAEALKPYYRQFCKRPCFHNEYLETFNRPNVTLVDTAGRGVDRITARGVEVRGHEYALDCLIYATGFEVGTDYSHRAGMAIVGCDDRTLAQAWSGGVRTLHGMQVHGFPNCFILNNSQAGFTANYPHLLDEQATHIAHILAAAGEQGYTRIEATAQGEDDWVALCLRRARDSGDFLENCTPGYYNNEGRVGERSVQDGFFGGGSIEYFRILGQWRAKGDWQGLVLR
jgi:cyclohexanone monooxygenase